jgi:hypothetical protein
MWTESGLGGIMTGDWRRERHDERHAVAVAALPAAEPPAPSGGPIRTVPQGVELGGDGPADVCRKRVVRTQCLLREQGDTLCVAGDLGLVRDLPGQADACREPAQILRLGGEFELDHWGMRGSVLASCRPTRGRRRRRTRRSSMCGRQSQRRPRPEHAIDPAPRTAR